MSSTILMHINVLLKSIHKYSCLVLWLNFTHLNPSINSRSIYKFLKIWFQHQSTKWKLYIKFKIPFKNTKLSKSHNFHYVFSIAMHKWMSCKGIIIMSLSGLVSKGVETPSRSESDKKPHGLRWCGTQIILIAKCLTCFQGINFHVQKLKATHYDSSLSMDKKIVQVYT